MPGLKHEKACLPPVAGVDEAGRGPLAGPVVAAARRALEAGDVTLVLPYVKASGEVEVLARDVRILNEAKTPPFPIAEETPVSEDVRLKYRYIDIRRERMQKNLRVRAAVNSAIRREMERNGFLEVETPFLMPSTPEGAREFLVPSRKEPGSFYALPQSPQLYKQILMVAGYDRYVQVARCFRDEDLRADRQPEFTQIDIETSFLSQGEITDMMEKMICSVFKEVLNIDLPQPFPRMSFDEAMNSYGSDKPDLRVPLKLVELTDAVRDVDFKVFREAANFPDGRVAALNIPQGGALTRKEIDDYTAFVGIYGAKGLAYIKVNDVTKLSDEGLQSPIVKFMTPEILGEILRRTGAQNGDLIFFGADRAKVVNDALGALRVKVGHEKGHAEAGWRPVWVVDFPAFEYDEESKRWNAAHHPFTSPLDAAMGKLDSDPRAARAKAYDLVLNGWELGSGSVRIHRADIQAKVFQSLGISDEEAESRFGFLMGAFRYGAPPHAGFAFGIDRLVAIFAGEENIREVIAFPKTQSGSDLMTGAPKAITERQIRDLRIRVNPKV